MTGKNFLTNRHFVVAMIVTPILAVIAYFGVDRMVSEPPHRAQAGQSYALVAGSDCRYSSGHCSLKNGSVKLVVSVDMQADKLITLFLESVIPLQSASLALVPDAEAHYPPLPMQALDAGGLQWTLTTSLPESASPLLRIVAVAEGSAYYGETGLEFSHYETSFNKDFRRQ